MPLLVSTGRRARGRVVGQHRGASIRFDDLQGERSFSGTRAYGQSKLANLLFAFALARRLAPTQVTVNAVHPGVVRSGIDRGMTGVLGALTRLAKPFLLTPEGGAATSVHVATAPELVGVTGRYFAKEREARPSSLARDEALQERLFVESPPSSAFAILRRRARRDATRRLHRRAVGGACRRSVLARIRVIAPPQPGGGRRNDEPMTERAWSRPWRRRRVRR